ncbi:hypothetical protein POPTR_018G064450v4, partial [Populus trichocarpa]
NRGAANQINKRHFKELIRKYHPSIIVLLETHVRFDRVVVFWKKQGFTAVAIVVEANGHASGIWILTNGGNCLISIIDAMTQCVTVLKITAGSFNWFFSAVYASPISSLWTHFWDQLITVRSLANGPWILIGDSNEVINYSFRNSWRCFLYDQSWKIKRG